MGDAIGTAPPVGHFGLVDLVAPIVDRLETGRVADGAVDVDHTAADSADQMVMVVANPILESSRRTRGLYTADETRRDQHTKRVVHRLERDGPDFGSHHLGHPIGSDMRLTRDRPENSQALGGDLNAVLTKQIGRFGGHQPISVDQILE